VAWDLCRKDFPSLIRWEWEEEEGDEEEGGLFVLPGTYTARVKYGGLEEKTTIVVKPDPRLKRDEAGLKQSYAMGLEVGGWIESLDKILKVIANHQQAIGTLQGTIPAGKDKEEQAAPEALKKLKEAAVALGQKLKGLKNRIVPDEDCRDSRRLEPAGRTDLLPVWLGRRFPGSADPGGPGQVPENESRAEGLPAEFNQFHEKELLPFRSR